VRASRLIAAACILLLAAPPAAGASVLQGQIQRLVARSHFASTRTGIVVYDRGRSRFLAVYHGRLEMHPASNVKLTTSAAVLGRVGLGTRLTTRVLATGTLRAGTLHGRLWLVGDGDPSLSTLPFSRLAFAGSSGLVHNLAAGVRVAGIRRVTGGVYGDESAFDSIRRGPVWKNDSFLDCPPLSALSVNEGWAGFGSLATVPSQALNAAQQFVRALQRQRIAIGHGAHTGVHPASARPVTSERSPTMHKLVYEMDQVSDNFFAETLTKDLAVGAGRRGSTRAGTTITRNYLRSLGVDLAGAHLFDGSGLSKGDRLSPRQIVGILRHAAVQPYGWFYRHALPLAGVSGTLYNRMRSGPAHRNALAKTGTLDGASALSGYVTTRNGHHLAFSIVMNERHIDVPAAHVLQDRIVQLLAGSSPGS
jgi:D-alanyl-D-alanine carboxypeptidase/D-alanyl-D-alanine-endopeptidase (penicillin-binding protein 4)